MNRSHLAQSISIKMDSNHVTNCHSPKSRGGPGLESPTHTPPTAYIWCQRGGIIFGYFTDIIGKIEDSSVQTDTRNDLCQKSRRITDTLLLLKSREPQTDFRTTDFRTTYFRTTDSRTTDSWTIWFTKLRKNIFCCLSKETF